MIKLLVSIVQLFMLMSSSGLVHTLGRIHRSSEALSVRIENIERRRMVRSSNSSHGEDEGYEEDKGGWRNLRINGLII